MSHLYKLCICRSQKGLSQFIYAFHFIDGVPSKIYHLPSNIFIIIQD